MGAIPDGVLGNKEIIYVRVLISLFPQICKSMLRRPENPWP